MGVRHKGRESALQLLYQIDVSGDASERAFIEFWQGQPDRAREGQSFAEALVNAVLERRAELDSVIDAAADNWQVERLSRIDLNLLRLGVCELLEENDVPAEVVVSEAIDIARKYCDVEAPAFINGVLDRVARERGLFDKT